MTEVETRHWWYVTLHDLVYRSLLRNETASSAAILDAGCGTGGLQLYLQARGFSNLTGFDLSDEAVSACRQRGLDVERIDMRRISDSYAGDSFDVIVSNDTLCYLGPEEQASWLRQCSQILKPGGLLICNVPALDVFGGIHDRSVGIEMRFTRSHVRQIFARSGIVLSDMMFWPFILSPLVYLIRLSQRIRLTLYPQTPIRSDIDLPPAPVNEMLKKICSLENTVLRRKPFGSSLFVTGARRKV